MRRCSAWLQVVCLALLLGGVGTSTFSGAQSGKSSPASTSGGYRIAGTVVSKADRRPLARARVSATDSHDAKKFESMITSEDGKFEFTGVPAGKYVLRAAKRGYISASYDQHEQFFTAIVTGAGLDTETLELKLAADAVITGKVLDEVGEPVRHATVTVYHEQHNQGESRIRPERKAQTDDRGEYEITPLQPGNYFLSVTAKPWYAVHPPSAQPQRSSPPSQASPEVASASEPVEEASSDVDTSTLDRALFDVTYPTTYYPDVTSADSAIPIPIQGGERLQLNFHLNPVPSLRLIFHVPKEANGGFHIPTLEQPSFDGSTYVSAESTRTISPGVVEISGIPAGSYDVVMHSPEGEYRLDSVSLNKDAEVIDATKSAALVKVKATVEVEGKKSPPQLTVTLHSEGRVLTGASTGGKPPEELDLRPVPPGKYEFSVYGQGGRYFVSHISATGAEVSGNSVTVEPGSSPSLTLTVVTGTADVEGVVKKSGKPFAGAMVVLVPKNPESDFDLFRRDQTDQDGTFSLHNVVAGAYTALAIEDGWDLDWSKAGVISAYLKRGRKIEVGGAGGQPVKIAEPLEVQSK